MTFWPGTKTPISRGNAFDHAFRGQSVMLDHSAKRAVRVQTSQKRMSAQERNAQTVAFSEYRLVGAPKLSAKAIEGLTNAKRHARDRKARGKA